MGTQCKTLAYSYIRFSSKPQEKGDSTRRQLEARDKWLAKQDGKVVLDESLRLKDLGKSAYKGEHRKNPDRNALAGFLRAVEQGKIPAGSYLLVESLDRLSREDTRPAFRLLDQLIEAGIRVVQLEPVEQIYDKTTDTMQLMMAIVELSRGHNESKVKSTRLGAAWAAKRQAAATGQPQARSQGKVLTRICPRWLHAPYGVFVEVPEACAAVRRIFDMCIEGHGTYAIAKQLNKEKVPPFGGKSKNEDGELRWTRSYVEKILRNKATLGEYQAYTEHGVDKRTKVGEPVQNYYPAIITQLQWDRAQGALASRRHRGGKPGGSKEEAFCNPFAGLLHDARTGGSLHRKNKKNPAHALLIPYRACDNPDPLASLSYNYQVFETAILSKLAEVDYSQLATTDETSKVEELQGRVAQVKERIAKLKAALLEGDVAAVVQVLREQETQLNQLNAELTTAQQAVANPLADSWEECQNLAAVVQADPSVRVRLRSVLRRVVKAVWVLIVPRGKDRIAEVQVHFHDGSRRDYLIRHHMVSGNAVARKKSYWKVRSWLLSEAAGLNAEDLANADEARCVEGYLQAVPVESLFPN